MGAPPVPVPPPIPAVINTISDPSMDLAISSYDSIAALWPISGLAPAPKPRVNSTPNWIFFSAEWALRA